MTQRKLTKEEKKQMKKQFFIELKKAAKQKGYKSRNGIYFKVKDGVFIFVLGGFVNGMETHNFNFYVRVKKYVYDDIFWKIINMEENIQEPDSLRAIGAFTAPSITISDIQCYIQDDLENWAKWLMEQAEENVDKFLKNHSINEYVLEHEDIFCGKMLKFLAYIDMGMEDQARQLAMEEVKKTQRFDFENEGKHFFEWACEYLEPKKMGIVSAWIKKWKLSRKRE